MTIRKHTGRYIQLIVAFTLGAVGCSLEEQSIPPLSGPSELGMSITLTATPNQLPRDGSSQAVVTILARDPQGRAIAGQQIRLTLPTSAPSGTTLTTTVVTTDAEGRATFGVIAPTQSSIGNTITVTATPEGANLDLALPRQVTITVSPANTSRPTPSFTFTPATPEVNQVVTFNATGTTDEGTACNETCTYQWNFGGEGTATGRIVNFQFREPGAHVVALTVTDASGAVETTRSTVTVSATGQPTGVSIDTTPNCLATLDSATPDGTPCVAGRAVAFTAAATAATNHRIVNYNWTWGDGGTNQTGAAGIQHTYSLPGTYLVRLVVTDDLGQSSEASDVIFVGNGLRADFSNTAAVAGQAATFDASASFSGSGTTISLYTWSWGDGSPSESKETTSVNHTFAVAGTYSVTLTITDSAGRTATRTRSITVSPAP